MALFGWTSMLCRASVTASATGGGAASQPSRKPGRKILLIVLR